MPFEQAHQLFIENHHARRSGERKGRLMRGHNYAEKLLLQLVWWPLFGNFDNLLVIGPHLLRNLATTSISPEEKEVLRLAVNLGKPIRPKDIILHSDVNFRTARKWLYGLVEKGILRSITCDKYACYYELKEGAWQHLI
ncbi:hypothetical protein M5X11_03265 [Paenibacillus alginolyticus]|uniref:hypothetical protein n=1 Tax=Paenibacillus alginolyticus TaxID=59839 RepID=UPI000403EC44|nr:hypothetical protein [Paenibacillus alginolyticus]MCY9664003.1 hypothetical protein [Paenibacillus alginolyticus]